MTEHRVGTREEWKAERDQLLEREKEHTRLGDELAKQRRELPWIEVDNRQSNFDESTGTFVVASDNAVIDGIKVGRYLQTYSKGDVGPSFGFAYDLNGSGRTIVRGGFGVFWNFTPGGTSGSKAQNQPFLQATALNATPSAYGADLLLNNLLAPHGHNKREIRVSEDLIVRASTSTPRPA